MKERRMRYGGGISAVFLLGLLLTACNEPQTVLTLDESTTLAAATPAEATPTSRPTRTPDATRTPLPTSTPSRIDSFTARIPSGTSVYRYPDSSASTGRPYNDTQMKVVYRFGQFAEGFEVDLRAGTTQKVFICGDDLDPKSKEQLSRVPEEKMGSIMIPIINNRTLEKKTPILSVEALKFSDSAMDSLTFTSKFDSNQGTIQIANGDPQKKGTLVTTIEQNPGGKISVSVNHIKMQLVDKPIVGIHPDADSEHQERLITVEQDRGLAFQTVQPYSDSSINVIFDLKGMLVVNDTPIYLGTPIVPAPDASSSVSFSGAFRTVNLNASKIAPPDGKCGQQQTSPQIQG